MTDGQRFISRNRKPRVHISYQDPYDAERKVEPPFVMGVIADLSGNRPGVDKPAVDERKFLEFDMDNFDKRMGAIEPGAAFRVANKLGDEERDQLPVDLKFRKMEDFSPAGIARQVPALAHLLEAREQLTNLLRYMDGKAAASDQIKALLADPKLMSALQERLSKPLYQAEPE